MEKQKRKHCFIIGMSDHILKRQMIISALKGGQFFSVTWRKIDGTVETMNARCGVIKHLKNGKKYKNGSTNSVKHLSQYLTVYKTKNGYRNLNLDTVQVLRLNGYDLHFDDTFTK